MVKSNPLSVLRNDVKEILNEAGIRAYDYAATKAVMPYAVVVPDEPYLEPSESFGSEYTAHLAIELYGPKGVSEVQTASIDSMIVEAVIALQDEFNIVSVAEPKLFNTENSSNFGAVIQIEASINLDERNN